MNFRHTLRVLAVGLVAGLSVAWQAPAALANQINTGGKSGAYFGRFCPELQKVLKKNAFEFECAPSQGSRDNIQRVIANPNQIGYAQFDVYALEREMLGGASLLTTLRTDMGRECLFMVTKNRDLATFGDIASVAPDLRFVLPPEKSGSAATFEFLQHIDPDGLGQARDVTYSDSTDQAIAEALADERTVTLFVQFPDPNNERFKTVNKAGGVFVPVLDRSILRQQIDGEKLYYAQDTTLSNPEWHKLGTEVVTACTPIVMFTGSSQRIDGDTAKQDHEDLIKTARAITGEDLQPKEGFFRNIWKKTKELSAKSVEKALELSDQAREKAGPAMERARERAGELAEQARDKAGELADDARELAGQAREKAGEWADEARERGAELLEDGREFADETLENFQDEDLDQNQTQ